MLVCLALLSRHHSSGGCCTHTIISNQGSRYRRLCESPPIPTEKHVFSFQHVICCLVFACVAGQERRGGRVGEGGRVMEGGNKGRVGREEQRDGVRKRCCEEGWEREWRKGG